jgi:predicted peptidase
MPQQAQSIDLEIRKNDRLNYLLFLPEGYSEKSADRWPLILFLHGSGERGDDLNQVKRYGLPKRLETWPDCPFVVVSPQCPAESYWTFKLDALDALLDHVLKSYAVDPARVYLTGMSMGGLGTWLLAMIRPERFAALAPVCGRGNRTTACLIKDLPIWVFHGAKDETVPIGESERMVDALKACGADVRFTVYTDAGHDSWTETYDNSALYEWFLKHRKR